ncbi:hypothetical protein [Bizionia sp.]|uniref:hypothetical protein n=1 Tax=Bizionia sp. TaxID=1954480 RepID=UPI003A915164
MRNKSHSHKKSNTNRQAQDTQLFLNSVIKTIEKKTGFTFQELKERHTQKELYRIGLYYVTTTNKTICEALNIPVEAGTRRKRDLEKEARLICSKKKHVCPVTKYKARFLSTNPKHIRKRL